MTAGAIRYADGPRLMPNYFDDHDELGDPGDRDGAADLDNAFAVTCPYCGEPGEIRIGPDVLGTVVEHCAICRTPWRVDVGYDDGVRCVQVTRGRRE